MHRLRSCAVLVLAIAAGGPFLMRDLARGISAPAWGISTALWLAWQVALFLVGVSVVRAGATGGRAALRGWRGLRPAIAPGLAITAALQQLGRNGVPVYVFYRQGRPPVVLSEVLGVDEVRAAIAQL